MATTAIVVSAVAGTATAIDSRNQSKKAANKAEDEADAQKKAEIAKGRREGEKRQKKLRAFQTGSESLVAKSGVAEANKLGA